MCNHKYKDKFKGFSAGSNPSGKINPHVKTFLEKKGFNLEKYFSKNFDEFLKDIDFNLCFQSFRKCWERSCHSEDVFQEGQFRIDFKK